MHTMYKQFYFVLGQNLQRHNSKSIDDVQILYGGVVHELGSVGHWICTHYQAATRTLFVYDSLYQRSLTSNQLKVIKILYPKRNSEIIYVEPKYIQTEYVSCGVFAIFHATTILMGHDPTNVDLTLNYVNGDTSLIMRLHILKMFANRQLALLP